MYKNEVSLCLKLENVYQWAKKINLIQREDKFSFLIGRYLFLF